MASSTLKKIAIIGGGPSALFLFKGLLESKIASHCDIHIFERTKELGMGMPYSRYGANKEHITNVSDNEIPNIQCHFGDWLADAPQALIQEFQIDKENHNPYKVLPRLFFGAYLSAQFELLLHQAKASRISHQVHLETEVTDLSYDDSIQKSNLLIGNKTIAFDIAIICTGHHWPKKLEDATKHYFESPYPPLKLQLHLNHAVALTGSSLTAIDAIRTLARANGHFEHLDNGQYRYHKAASNPSFKLVVHSLHGIFPGMRFHLEDTQLKDDHLLSQAAIDKHIEENDGFLSLDFVFEKDFKDILSVRDPKTYQIVKDMDVETFAVHYEKILFAKDPIAHLKQDYKVAERSIEEEESLHWREILAMLSFAINYPAKHLSAEDKLRLDLLLKPLISHVIAFIPQGSAREILALADAGVLEIVKVDQKSKVVAHADGGINYHVYHGDGQKNIIRYHTYVNCMGQPQWDAQDFIFPSLWGSGSVAQATYRFRSTLEGNKYYKQQGSEPVIGKNNEILMPVKGVKINDAFQIVDQNNNYNRNIYLMAVPHMGGYNPDYSGLDFGEEASKLIVEAIEKSLKENE